MMPSPRDIEIAIRLGATERRVPVVALAALLRVQTVVLRDALAELLRGTAIVNHPQPVDNRSRVVEGEPTEGEERFVSFISFHERSERKYLKIVSTKGGGAGEENTARPAILTAEQLAAALDDWPSLGHLRELVTRHPSALLDAALRGISAAVRHAGGRSTRRKRKKHRIASSIR